MQKSFHITGAVRLDIQLTAGEIEIDAGPTDRVEVELVAHDAESQQLVDAARVELHQADGRSEVVVDVPARPKSWSLGSLRRQSITCRVSCPPGSDLRTRTRSAGVRARGELGEVDVATASGDVAVEDARGALSLKSASGDLTARSVGGRATANTASGDVAIESVTGDLAANTASGDIRIGSVGGDVKANSASGDTTIGAVRAGAVSVNAASGDVHIGIRRGSRVHLDCSTVSGEARSELDLGADEPEGDGPFVDLKARTASGDITITRAPATADVHAVQA